MLNYRLNQNDSIKLPDAKTSAAVPPRPKPKPTDFWQRLSQGWNNLSFRTKLTILLMGSAALPVIAVTQGMVVFDRNRALQELQQSLEQQGKTFAEQYVTWTQKDSQGKAEHLAKLVQVTEVDLNNPTQVAARRDLLQNFLKIDNGADPEVNKNFQIFTDAQGRTVAQDIETLAQDNSSNPPLPSLDQTLTPQKFRPVSLPAGIFLGDVPIVKNALKTGRPLDGIELLQGTLLQRLGLEEQANIGERTQPTQNLPEPKQPFPPGTYDIDGGKAGLLGMAVYPIKIKNKLVGTVIVGSLLNRDYGLVDKFSQKYKVPSATVFAQDWRVSTNIPYTDGQSRSIGTRASREVATNVLNRGQDFIGQANVVGKPYLAFYTPLYDHQKELNPSLAKPVGMAYVGASLVEEQSYLREQEIIAYSIGGGILLLVGLVAILVADSFSRPIRRLASFAQQLGAGEKGVRLEITVRQDEIGVLSQELNQMADSIATKQASLKEENRRRERYARQSQLYADIASYRASEFAELKPIFNQAVTGARDILKADRVVIYLFNPDWSGYIAAESVLPSWPSASDERINDPCIGEKLIAAYKQGRIVITNNVFAANFSLEHLKLMERLQIKASLVIPILKNEQLFGLLIAHHCATTHDWQQYEISFLSQVADQLGLVLDRVSLLEQKVVETERLQLLRQVTIRINQSVESAEVMNTAVAETRLALKADRVVVYGLTERWLKTIVAESVAPGWPSALGANIDDPCFHQQYAELYRQGRVQATNNIYTAGLTACHLKQLEPFAVKANLVAPIIRGGELLGLLIAHQCSAPRQWQQSEIDLFSQLAIQVAYALDVAMLLEQQKAAQEQLQQRALTLLQEVEPISKGDLTIRAKVTADEIGTVADSYNATVASLRRIVTQVQTAAEQMAATTTSNESSVNELSHEIMQQAAEIATALERIQAMSEAIQVVATSAEQVESMALQATEIVEAGDAAMDRTVAGIETIRETVTETAKKVQQLGESSQKISKVVSLIGRFAAQTNLLALKASIEAARAGEEGRGFAVLAEEVRALAGQSAAATAEVESLVAKIQTETREVVAAMEVGTQQVLAGSKLVDDTRQSLNSITAATNQISALVEGIAATAVAQSQASDVVSQSMYQVVATANKNSSEATQVSAAFKELLVVAQQLQASVAQFKVS